MPRARTTTATEDETVIKRPRTTRTRAVSSDQDARPAPVRRRRVSETVEETSHHTTAHADSGRKAPTALGDRHRRQARNSRSFLIAAGVCFTLFLLGFGIGLSDRGVIDVVAVVNERNEKINRGEVRDANGQTITQTVGVQSPDTRPNGGMVPIIPDTTTPPPTPVAPPDVASSTASTTDTTTATSTASSSAAQ